MKLLDGTRLTEHGRTVITNARDVAAVCFDRDAREVRNDRLRVQFRKQAQEARDLRVTIEDADEIEVVS